MHTIGYMTIPIRWHSSKGPLTVGVGLTYVRDKGNIEVWDSWINPSIEKDLDTVDKMTFIAQAARKLMSMDIPLVKKEWKEVSYG